MQSEIEDIIKDNFHPFTYQRGSYDIHKASIEIEEHINEFIDWLMDEAHSRYHIVYEKNQWFFEREWVLYTREDLFLIWSSTVMQH